MGVVAVGHQRHRQQGAWRFAEGQTEVGSEIAPGGRVMVYQGPISSPFLEDTLTLRIEADGARLPGMQRLQFHFELDTE